MTSNPRVRLRHRTYEKASPLLAVTLACMSVFGPFSMDTVYPAFKQMGEQFGVSDSQMQQLVGIYLLAFALTSIFHGALSDAVGRKKVVIVGAVLYAAASFAAAFCASFGLLLVFRACQGATAGAGMVLGRAVVRDLFDGAEAQKQMSMVQMIFALAPAAAPVIGGWLLLIGPWPSIFFFLSIWGAFVAILVAITLPESLPAEKRQPLRIVPLVKGLHEVARHLRFQRLAIAMILLFAGQFLYISSAPLFVRNVLGQGEQDFWKLFVPLIIGILGGASVQKRLADRLSPTRLVALGVGIIVATGILNIVLALIPATSAKLPWAVLAPMGISFGAQITFPVVSIMMLDLFPERRGAAASVQAFEQLLFNAVLASVISPLVATSVLMLALASFLFTLLGAAVFFAWPLQSSGELAAAEQSGFAID